MATQNTISVMRQWSKTLGVAWFAFLNGVSSTIAASTDALFQIFTQLNALANDTQNVAYQSAALTGGAVATPTISAFRNLAGGVYQLSSGALPALTGAVFGSGATTTLGLWWYTVDSTNTFHVYASPGNGATTRAALTLPNPLPSGNEVVLGMVEITATNVTFTPGTTLLNAAGIAAVFVNFTGDTGFTAFGLTEMATA